MSTLEIELELIPGLESQPLFKTPEEYEKFREGFIEEVGPKLEQLDRARKLSEHEARFRIVR